MYLNNNNHSKENNMKIQYADIFVQNLGMVDPTDDTKIIQYFVMNRLGLSIRIDIYMSHMFCACSFSNNTEVSIAINNNKYFPSLDKYTTVFSWGAGETTL